ncbi:MAG: ABC transporter permease [Planctomycetaceae bacterium]|uniref:Ribose transport system permease protein RbsC n=1 Tax=Lacipirellula limnantheis TaxID=2528024 RepID=A0A517U0P6_9BACT|nr:ABC transporter permease [Lacipirellula limnantheis]MBL9162522.1 ABC transporter permease [Planctomycetaceae bacterium]QDT74199.1 Ribose transport system permease protein RbsC [Lacipirellula limnantheis]
MPADPRLPTRIRSLLDQLGPLLALLGVWSLFAALRWDIFPTWENTQSILLQTAVIGVAALGGTMVIISGGIDLSVGSLIALVSVTVALVLRGLASGGDSSAADASGYGDAALAAVIGVGLAGLCGLSIGTMVIGRVGRVAAFIAGSLVGYIAWRSGLDYRAALPLAAVIAAAAWWGEGKLNSSIPLSPFIVTLGMWGALRGAAKGLADNSAVYPPATPLNSLMRFPSAPIEASLILRPQYWWSPGVWIFLALACFIAGVLRYTQFGRHIYAIGSNEQTARLCGIHVERVKLKLYACAALLTGIAGVLQFSFVEVGDPTTGASYELGVIAAAVIGGASLSGGVGTILGTVAGALLMSTINNGCTKIGLEVWMQEIVTGAIIVAAVTLDKLRHRGAG